MRSEHPAYHVDLQCIELRIHHGASLLAMGLI
jgi:hypothetical protein